jgi:hypothetical protein
MNFKQLMIDKGEKVGLFVAGGFALLLTGLGAMAYVNSAFDPEAKKIELAKRAGEIKRKIDDQNAKPDPLEKQYETKFEFDKVFAAGLKTLFFDPFAQPDNKRVNPAVTRVKAIQADALAVKIPAYDLQEINGKIRIGVLQQRKTGAKQKEVDIKSSLNNLQRRRFNQSKQAMKGNNPPPGGFGGSEGGPGGSQGGPGGPPGGLGGGPGGRGGPPGFGAGGPGGIGGEGSGMGSGFDVKGERMDISYVDVDDEKAFAGKRLALTLYTQRMIVVQAAFPYKDQLENIQKSMKISTMTEFLNKPESQPTFKGLVVQRREIGPDGSEGSWVPLKFEESYKPIFMRKFADQEDDYDLNYVKLHPANRLVMPLPLIHSSINTSKYPAVRLPELTAEIEKRKQLDAPPPAAQQENKFKGEGDIFNPQGGDTKSLGGGAFGEFGEGSAPGLGSMGSPGGGRPGFGGMGKGGFGEPGEGQGPGGNIQNFRNFEPLNYVLVRIVDTDPFIQPGRKYQYRFQIKMENPNYKKPELVSLKSDAETSILYGEWSEPSETVTVPGESYLYSVDATMPDPKDPKKVVPMNLKDGQGMLQMHRWQEQVRVEKFKEPFGDWLVVDTVVSRGARVGGRQFVNLPLWSSEFNNFVLREFKDDKVARGKEPRRGVFLDLTRTDLFVVDVEGGRLSYTTPRNRRIDDETSQEILIFSEENGSMRLLSSAADRESTERKSREDAWKSWVAEVEAATRKTNPTGGKEGGSGGGRFGD